MRLTAIALAAAVALVGCTGAPSEPEPETASAAQFVACLKAAGVEARGSINRASFRSMVVTESEAFARPFSAILARISISRMISAAISMIGLVTRMPNSEKPMSMRRLTAACSVENVWFLH